MPKNAINSKFALLLIIGIALMLIGIVYLKTTAHAPLPNDLPDTTATAAMAVPDTSLAPDVRPIVTDTVPPARPDTLERDPRPADEAGAEDGYWNGYYDGIAGRELTENDITSGFPTKRERNDYARAYTEGYHRGYAEGSNSRTGGSNSHTEGSSNRAADKIN